jgi:hypothetical protein
MLALNILYFSNLREKAWVKHWDALVLSYLDLDSQNQDFQSSGMQISGKFPNTYQSFGEPQYSEELLYSNQ